MLPQFCLIALGTLASEDLTCIATGVLIAQGRLSFAEGALACLFGIFLGDVLLFLTGRLAGKSALQWKPLGRFLQAEQVERGAEWLSEKGLIVVFLSRFTPGLRLPTYFAAGLVGTRLAAFSAYFLLAAAVWTPLLVGATVFFGDGLLRAFFNSDGAKSIAAFAGVFGALAIVTWQLRPLLHFTGRRRLVGFVKRKLRWEFWPAWAAYLPLIPYFLYLAFRNRSLTLFTLANPGIPTGGLAGESKSQILCHLSRTEGAVAEFHLLPPGRAPADHPFGYPVVLKPDVGERGSGVAIVHSHAEMARYLAEAAGETILQRYVPGVEFGVFYYRYPEESRGRIFSITEKRFPVVTGDGRSTLRELILRDPRAVCIAATYERLSKHPMSWKPARGEQVRLIEIGSHCRGAVFLDGTHLKTPALEETIDIISQAHPGFYFGRLDVRAPSVTEFQQGRFCVIELNGVSSEATHIYDPAVSLAEAYRVMFWVWRTAFEIGAQNRARGLEPMGLLELARWVVRWPWRGPTAGAARQRCQAGTSAG